MSTKYENGSVCEGGGGGGSVYMYFLYIDYISRFRGRVIIIDYFDGLKCH